MPAIRLAFSFVLLFIPMATALLAQQAQDPWERISRFDANQDGKVSREEFQGPVRAFERMDANGDGLVTREEASALRGRMGPGPRENPGPADGGMGLLPQLDGNGDGRISMAEWNEFFKKADENGDDILQPEEWQAATRMGRLKDSAPAVGSPAPQVKGKRLTNHREVDLARPERTTVLVFGSYT